VYSCETNVSKKHIVSIVSPTSLHGVKPQNIKRKKSEKIIRKIKRTKGTAVRHKENKDKEHEKKTESNG